jgi:hypothetical protein
LQRAVEDLDNEIALLHARVASAHPDPVAAQQFAWQQLENLRQQQASSLAYFDSFWMIAVLTFAVAFLVLFTKGLWLRKAVMPVQSD